MPYTCAPTAVQITLANGDYQLYKSNPLGAIIYLSWTVLSTLLLLSLLIAILSYDFQVRPYRTVPYTAVRTRPRAPSPNTWRAPTCDWFTRG